MRLLTFSFQYIYNKHSVSIVEPQQILKRLKSSKNKLKNILGQYKFISLIGC